MKLHTVLIGQASELVWTLKKVKSLIVASSWSHIYLLIQDALSFEHKIYHECLCFSYFEHAVSIFVKFGVRVMPLEATQISHLVIFYSVCNNEMVSTLTVRRERQ